MSLEQVLYTSSNNCLLDIPLKWFSYSSICFLERLLMSINFKFMFRNSSKFVFRTKDSGVFTIWVNSEEPFKFSPQGFTFMNYPPYSTFYRLSLLIVSKLRKELFVVITEFRIPPIKKVDIIISILVWNSKHHHY